MYKIVPTARLEVEADTRNCDSRYFGEKAKNPMFARR
jgi:hypothetical protein